MFACGMLELNVCWEPLTSDRKSFNRTNMQIKQVRGRPVCLGTTSNIEHVRRFIGVKIQTSEFVTLLGLSHQNLTS